MTKYPVLSIVIPVMCSLLCFKIDHVTCASYILTENPEVHVDLNKPISERTSDDSYVASSAYCCSNATCIYSMVASALQDSQEFDQIRSLVLVSNAEPPDFLPIKVQVFWTEAINGRAMIQSHNLSYVWGGTPAKAVFGPVQDIFPTPSMYSVILAIVSLVEEAITPKELVGLQAENINARLQEEHHTVILNISHTCISNSTKMNPKTLNLTIQMCIKEALKLVSLLLT